MQAGIITADSCAASLKACDHDDFPNLYILLKIAAILSVTSVDLDEIVNLFQGLHPRMMQLSSLLYE